jgi:hypothetical protein
VDLTDRSVWCSAGIPQGGLAWLMEGDPDSLGTPGCDAPAELKVADSWGDAAWGCAAHVEEAIINVRSVFIASEELGGLTAYLHR